MSPQAQVPVRPWWRSRQWWIAGGALIGFGVTGISYLGWAAEHQHSNDSPPLFARILVPFAALYPEPRGWLDFGFVALLNVAMWAGLVYLLVAAIARIGRWA